MRTKEQLNKLGIYNSITDTTTKSSIIVTKESLPKLLNHIKLIYSPEEIQVLESNQDYYLSIRVTQKGKVYHTFTKNKNVSTILITVDEMISLWNEDMFLKFLAIQLELPLLEYPIGEKYVSIPKSNCYIQIKNNKWKVLLDTDGFNTVVSKSSLTSIKKLIKELHNE